MTKPLIFKRLRPVRGAFAIALGLIASAGASQAQMLQQPLQTGGGGTPPNLMFTLDDSGSMWWECVPDALCAPGSYGLEAIPRLDAVGLGNRNRLGTVVYDDVNVNHKKSGGGTQTDWSATPLLLSRQMRASAYNPLYYNPAIQYQPWLKSDGTRWPNANPSAAPVQAGASQTQDLTGTQTITGNKWCWATSKNLDPSSCASNTTQTAVIARYYNMSGNGTKTGDFTLVKIVSGTNFGTKAAGRMDCAGTVCTYSEEIQNFANWYTYYRTRALTAIAGTSEAFAAVPAEFRVGYGRINYSGGMNANVDGGSPGSTIERGVRAFSGTDKANFYNWLSQRANPSGGTPLRAALDNVGQYFTRADNRGPWGANPGIDDKSPHSACRRSFHVMMTDGMWNGGPAATSGATGNADGEEGDLITGPGGQEYTYQPTAPYKDDRSGTLADVAMYYWKTDLRGDLQNAIKPVTKPGQEDPAFWQHLVNYMIAFGVDGTLDNPGDLAALASGKKSWPDPSNGDAKAVDDLWHAAINSRGRMLSARNAAEYSGALRSIIADVISVEGSESGLGVSNVTLPSVGSSTKIYTPSFASPEWSGQVEAQFIDSTGKPTSTAWKSTVPAFASRNIYTYDTGATGGPKAVALQWASLSTAAKTTLWGAATGGEALVNYLRGDSTGEGVSNRIRKSRLGDIVNSTPALISDLVNYAYQYLPAAAGGPGGVDYGAETYARFLQAKRLRTSQLIVGANDGMVHAFGDDDGAETLAYMPRSVLGSVKQLWNQDYTHRYFVDGPIYEADVYDSVNKRWNNVVQGFGGAGGKYLYTIRMPVVTWTSGPKPSGLTKAQSIPSANDIWWEINDASPGFDEMGYVITKPETGVMRDGTWVTIFGNGYESKSGHAQLFIVNAMTGALIKKIDTGVGSSNGLGGIGVVRDGQQRIVAVYGGDLLGNMWKFDLSSSTVADWKVAFGGQPLVTVKNSNNQLEPISAKPNFRAFPTGGVMVLFGTGKLFAQGDEKDVSERTLYGVWDRVPVGSGAGTVNDTVVNLGLLSTQKTQVTPIPNSVGATYRTLLITPVDYKTQRGWRLPLVIGQGERSIDQPQIRFDSVLMQTVTPTGVSDDCQAAKTIRRAYLLDPFMSGTQAAPFDGDANGATESHIVDLTGSGENQLVMQTPICLGSQCQNDSTNDPPCTGPACNRIKCPKSGVILGAGAEGGIQACFGTDAIRRYWREIVTSPQS